MVGSACGIASWLAYAKIGYGEITVDTTGFNLPLLTGNVVSLGLSLLITVVGSLVFPDKAPFNWEELNSKITKTEDMVRTCNALLNYLIYLNPIWAVLQRWLSPSRMRSCGSSYCYPDFQKLQESLLKGRACIKPQYAPCLPPVVGKHAAFSSALCCRCPLAGHVRAGGTLTLCIIRAIAQLTEPSS